MLKGEINLQMLKQGFAKSDAAAREMMKRYMKGRNRDSSLSSYEKQKFEMR